ncbi:autoinducer binding domain-containing protein [Cereibacter sphaeroides]|uniref:autoinducer binding domain-containing protein n=1 Tax=Cereibacter sphaeroides TaxID=1063 RepID=UPI001F1AF00A|nr:autoinducer binding domain-containing protein [Cereibacter sphaeroides]MCE6959338.1 autoinducer binding domain-containing protein [Cereibacter sphaeroides]MCE6972930.1 autoinducer binding domain-containing protein [Cereibacter sphaeroides]
MLNVIRIRNLVFALTSEANWRFAIGLRIRFANPSITLTTYPESWLRHYDEKALLHSDPAILWGLKNLGCCRWSELADADPAGVFLAAADHGLRYGLIVSVGDEGQRSIGYFAHPDHEIAPRDADFALSVMERLHEATEGIGAANEDVMTRLQMLATTLRQAGTEIVPMTDAATGEGRQA